MNTIQKQKHLSKSISKEISNLESYILETLHSAHLIESILINIIKEANNSDRKLFYDTLSYVALKYLDLLITDDTVIVNADDNRSSLVNYILMFLSSCFSSSFKKSEVLEINVYQILIAIITKLIYNDNPIVFSYIKEEEKQDDKNIRI